MSLTYIFSPLNIIHHLIGAKSKHSKNFIGQQVPFKNKTKSKQNRKPNQNEALMIYRLVQHELLVLSI